MRIKKNNNLKIKLKSKQKTSQKRIKIKRVNKSRFFIFLFILTVSIIYIFSRAIGGKFEFPLINASNRSSFPSISANDKNIIKNEWEEWKKRYVTQHGANGFLRVQRDKSTNYDTTSQSMGHGLFLSVNYNDKETFDALYKFVKANFNKNNLMKSNIDPNNPDLVKTIEDFSNTNGDQFIAFSLIMAEKKWGSKDNINYRNEAKNLINALYTNCVEHDTLVLKPCDSCGGSNLVNPSYFSPAWYRIFADYTGNKNWLKVIDKCYDILNNITAKNNSSGLFPDWCDADGNITDRSYDFSYEAFILPLKLTTDYLWNKDKRALKHLDNLNKFFKNIDINQLTDIYTITGETKGHQNNKTLLPILAVSASISGDKTYADKSFREILAYKTDNEINNYYSNTLKLLSLVYLSDDKNRK